MDGERNAALEAREAKVQIQAHIAECARRYKDTAEALAGIKRDVAELLEQSEFAKGSAEQRRRLLGGIPNAFWAAFIAACGSVATIVLTHLWTVWSGAP
jgi:hypothetical protein